MHELFSYKANGVVNAPSWFRLCAAAATAATAAATARCAAAQSPSPAVPSPPLASRGPNRRFKHMDDNDSGLISYFEFAGMVREELLLTPKELPEKVLMAAWLALDVDGSGNLNCGEFGAFMQNRAQPPRPATPSRGDRLRPPQRTLVPGDMAKSPPPPPPANASQGGFLPSPRLRAAEERLGLSASSSAPRLGSLRPLSRPLRLGEQLLATRPPPLARPASALHHKQQRKQQDLLWFESMVLGSSTSASLLGSRAGKQR